MKVVSIGYLLIYALLEVDHWTFPVHSLSFEFRVEQIVLFCITTLLEANGLLLQNTCRSISVTSSLFFAVF